MSNTKKCLSCQHFGSHFRNLTNEEPLTLIGGWCSAPAIAAQIQSAGYIVARGSNVDIDTARDLCDKESDGIFVHYEPETPTAGVAFDVEYCTQAITGNCSCSSCLTPALKAAA